ncbi:EndoU domain-containing protein [Providencia burhodogranariea]|uniref:Bacterial EndoU nuclease domain-containing protein n=1 Tax=Providencia burhodogranariea DSM 19968 TaxID=1141662 RepID=K8X4J8_9GAMM|nr:EndoU domain-containing protein [Providencia burhodogranariea]EKT64597.1 hypothetical protein OOA_02332 [Providencia burhodogranariea DSM 19968]
MPKIDIHQTQWRQRIGHHTNKLDQSIKGQRWQDTRIKNIANHRGLHSSNAQQQARAQTCLELLSMLSTINRSDFIRATTGENAKKVTAQNIVSNAFANYRYEKIARVVHSGMEENRQSSKSIIPAAKYTDIQQAKDTTSTSKLSVMDSVSSALSFLTNSLSDPLKFPMAQALPLQNDANVAHPDQIDEHQDKDLTIESSEVEYNPRASLQSNDANKKIAEWLQTENRLGSGNISKEELLSAIATYFYDVKTSGAVDDTKVTTILGKKILAAANLYGGKQNEQISSQQAKSALRHWIFDNILGMSPKEYIAGKMEKDHHPEDYTISKANQLLTLQELYNNKQLYLNHLPREQWENLNTMWQSFIKEEMPFLRLFDIESVKNMRLDDYQFAPLYSGSQFLTDLGFSAYTPKEAINVGEYMWDLAFDEGITEDKISYFSAPAQFFMASHSSNRINRQDGIGNILSGAESNYLQYRQQVEVMHKDINQKFQDYSSAVAVWLSKGELADKIIDQCPTNELPRKIVGLKNNIGTLEKNREIAVEHAKQLYLNNIDKPCDNAPDRLNDEYRKLTSNVADRYREIDKYLIRSELEALPQQEYDFITAPDADVCLGGISMSTSRGTWSAYNHAYNDDINISLLKTDLISVKRDNKERIYALKGIHEGTEGYKIFRVDRDIHRYIDNGLLDYNYFGNNLVVTDSKIESPSDTFRYTIFTDNQKNLGERGDTQSFIDALSDIHRNKIYNGLDASGDDKSDIQKTWYAIKHIIPFYDCVEGVINNNPVQAVPSCLMDAVAFIPVFGQAASLSSKFGMGLMRGLRYGARTVGKGSLSPIVKNTLREISLPTITELGALSKGALRAVDPGFELLTRGSQKLGHFLVKQLMADAKTVNLGRKITVSGVVNNLPSALPITHKVALLPNSEIRTPIQEIDKIGGQEIYVRINPETGELFGKRYTLNSHNQLVEQIAFESPLQAPFSIKTKSFYYPILNKYINVAPSGIDNGQQIWQQLSPDRTKYIGRKYVINSAGKLENQPLSFKERMYNLKTEGLGGKGANKAAKQWKDPGFNKKPDLTILEKSTLEQISATAARKMGDLLQLEKGALYHVGKQYYLKYNNKYYAAEVDSSLDHITIYSQSPKDNLISSLPGSSQTQNRVKIMEGELFEGQIDKVYLTPGSPEEQILKEASDSLGNKGIIITEQLAKILEGQAGLGLSVQKATEITPINGLTGVFVKTGSHDYYIRHKDRFYLIKSTDTENKVFIYDSEGKSSFASLTKANFRPKNDYKKILPDNIRQHILHGDQAGGGHLFPGQQGKSIFPENWNAEKVINQIGDIATSSTTKWYAETEGLYTKTKAKVRWTAWEVRDKVRIKVIYEPANGIVITAFPNNAQVPAHLKVVDKESHKWI